MVLSSPHPVRVLKDVYVCLAMKFQLERIALFSDAVFAIAITLMMIEIKPPHLPHDATFREALYEFLRLIPTFTGTILSFFLIGIFWKRHHELMKYMAAYDNRVIMLNLGMLLSIAFIPFSTAFVFENLEAHSPLPLLVYNINYTVATLLNYRLFMYILNPIHGLRSDAFDKDLHVLRRELLFPIFVYILVSGLAFIKPSVAAAGYAAFGLQGLFTGRKKPAPRAAA